MQKNTLESGANQNLSFYTVKITLESGKISETVTFTKKSCTGIRWNFGIWRKWTLESGPFQRVISGCWENVHLNPVHFRGVKLGLGENGVEIILGSDWNFLSFFGCFFLCLMSMHMPGNLSVVHAHVHVFNIFWRRRKPKRKSKNSDFKFVFGLGPCTVDFYKVGLGLFNALWKISSSLWNSWPFFVQWAHHCIE